MRTQSFATAIAQMEAAIAEEHSARKRLHTSKAFIRVEEAKHAMTVAKTRLALARRVEMMERIKAAMLRGSVTISVRQRSYVDFAASSMGIVSVPHSTHGVKRVHIGRRWIGYRDLEGKWHDADPLLYQSFRSDIAMDCDGVMIEPPPYPFDKDGRFISTSVPGTGA
jgi:hypothetical protein